MLYIFDMGGVVLHAVFELQTILKEQGSREETFDLYKDDLMEDLSSGLLSEDLYWEKFNARYGTHVQSPRWGKSFFPELDARMVALITTLKEHHRVVCGTNTFEAHWQVSLERGDYAAFHKVYASHQMGAAKPDPRFWQIIIDAEGYPPEETIFIDDFPENVDAARRLGIKSLLFRDRETLMADLALSV